MSLWAALQLAVWYLAAACAAPSHVPDPCRLRWAESPSYWRAMGRLEVLCCWRTPVLDEERVVEPIT